MTIEDVIDRYATAISRLDAPRQERDVLIQAIRLINKITTHILERVEHGESELGDGTVLDCAGNVSLP